jgi:hypothetical protein
MVSGLPQLDQVDQVCDNCLAGKQRRHSFPSEAQYRAAHRLELVHGDLCGLVTPAAPSGNRFFFLLIDDLSRYMWLAVMRTKDQAMSMFVVFQAQAEVEAGRKLGTLRTDRGGEFTARVFIEYCTKEGIQRHLTAPYTPEQNGVIERRNQAVMGMARSMLKAMAAPGRFWGEVVATAVYILNRSPTQSVDGCTPYEVWHGVKPFVHHFRTFGCVAHVKQGNKRLSKLEDKSTPMVFIGYEGGSKAWRFYNPSTERVHISWDAVFEKDRAWEWGDDRSGDGAEPFVVDYFSVGDMRLHGQADQQQVVHAPGEPGSVLALTPLCGHRSPTPAAPGIVEHATPPAESPDLNMDHDDAPRRFRRLENILGPGSPPGLADRGITEEFLAAINEEPSSADEALKVEEWRLVMLEEMASIEENKTWMLVTLPRGHHAIGLKWVFKLKYNEAGDIVKHKARLVAKGCVQQLGIDFDEVFAPIARMESKRLVLAVAAHHGWPVHQMDVKSAFLNGDLNEEVYITQPPGFIAEGHEQKVLKLHKALYGLRQAPRAWNAKLNTSLVQLGFSRCRSEHGMYTRVRSNSRLVVGVYIDDLLIVGECVKEIDQFKDEMKQLFRMSDLGPLSYYLGIEVKQGWHGVVLCQSVYAKKLLEKAGMAGCNGCVTPMEPKLKLSKRSTSPAVDTTQYRNIIGSLRYLLHT